MLSLLFAWQFWEFDSEVDVLFPVVLDGVAVGLRIERERERATNLYILRDF